MGAAGVRQPRFHASVRVLSDFFKHISSDFRKSSRKFPRKVTTCVHYYIYFRSGFSPRAVPPSTIQLCTYAGRDGDSMQQAQSQGLP